MVTKIVVNGNELKMIKNRKTGTVSILLNGLDFIDIQSNSQKENGISVTMYTESKVEYLMLSKYYAKKVREILPL